MSETLWSALMVATAGGWVLIGAALWRTRRVMIVLPETWPGPGADLPRPKVSVLVPARDEAENIERTIRSLAAQDYPALEIVAVDDRSVDGTGEILLRLAAELPALRVIAVETLPAGWLGKNHANWLAVREASGEIFLFTDGDVVFAPGALTAAVDCMERRGLGHLAGMPNIIRTGMMERAFQTAFALLFCLRFRIWELSRPGSAGYIGIGAFNMVRKEDYLRAGGHQRLAMEVVDDVKLGLILRRSGAVQACADARALVSLLWYPGFRASLRGLVKNMFAGVEWNWPLLVLGNAAWMVMIWGPWIALMRMVGPAGPGISPWLPLANIILAAGLHGAVSIATMSTATMSTAAMSTATMSTAAMSTARKPGRGWDALAYPLMHTAIAGASLVSAAMATIRRGIVWRDTFYPLTELRRGCVRASGIPRSGAPGWGGNGSLRKER